MFRMEASDMRAGSRAEGVGIYTPDPTAFVKQVSSSISRKGHRRRQWRIRLLGLLLRSDARASQLRRCLHCSLPVLTSNPLARLDGVAAVGGRSPQALKVRLVLQASAVSGGCAVRGRSNNIIRRLCLTKAEGVAKTSQGVWHKDP